MAGSAYPKPIQSLVALFRRLPGVGGRTAERLALALLNWPEEDLQLFGGEIAALRERISFCEQCGNLAEGARCRICESPNRDHGIICVVEQATQIPVIENAGCFRGLYHVLGGRIVPLEGKGPDDLNIESLRERLAAGDVKELILATSPDVEGEATASFLVEEMKIFPVRITRIASGVPVGADLSFADSATMAMALGTRRILADGLEP